MKNLKSIILNLTVIFSIINFTYSQNAGVTSIGSKYSCPGTIISIPLTLSNSPYIESISLEIDYDGSVLSYLQSGNKDQGISNTNQNLMNVGGNITANASTISGTMKRLRIIWVFTSDLPGINSFSGTGLLCNISFRYLSGATTLSFNNSFGNCEYADTNYVPLIDTPSTAYFMNAQVRGYTLNGYYSYDNVSSTPLDSVWVFLRQSGIKLDSVRTDVNGFYQFSNVPDGTYNLTATTKKPWGGVNATDAVKVKRHFAGSDLLNSSILLHAADVNVSYSINTTDAVKITRRFVGTDTTFERGDWLFEKPAGGDTINVSYGLNDTIVINGADATQNFKGIAVGDVNGSYFPSPGVKSEFSVNLVNEGITKVNNGEYFELPVRVSESLSAGAISLILNFPSEYLQVEGVTFAGNTDNQNLLYKTNGNEIRISWFELTEPVNFNANDPILIISFKVKNYSGTPEGLFLKVQNNPLCEIADEFGEPYKNVTLNTEKLEINSGSNILNAENNPDNILSVYPNPARNIVHFDYNVPENENVNIAIYNITGEKVGSVVNGSILKGNYHSSSDISILPSGEYLCRMILNDGKVITNKLMITK